MSVWRLCTVEQAGPADLETDGRIYIKLAAEDGGFAGSRWFSAVDKVEKEMLAVALAAIPSKLLVRAMLSSTDEGGKIERLYLNART